MIALLKAATFGSAFIWSQRLFQRRLPLKDNDSIPNFVARVFRNRYKVFVRKLYFFVNFDHQFQEILNMYFQAFTFLQ